MLGAIPGISQKAHAVDFDPTNDKEAMAWVKPTITLAKAASGNVTLKKGTSYSLGASTDSGRITYKSSNPRVVSVTNKGKLKALRTGTAVITVTATKKYTNQSHGLFHDFDVRTQKFKPITTSKRVKVTVISSSKYKKVKSISVKAAKKNLQVGDSITLQVSANPSKASNKNVKFKTSNSSVLAVSETGKVIAKKPGKATVTVTSMDNAKAKKKIAFEVTAVDTLAQGLSGTCRWQIDKRGRLTFFPDKGTVGKLGFWDPYDDIYAPWLAFDKEIKSVRFSGTIRTVTAHSMFLGCSNLEKANLSGLDLTQVNNVNGMFYDCASLKTLDLPKLDVTNTLWAAGTFGNCYSLTKADLSKWKFNPYSLITNGIFANCPRLKSIGSNKILKIIAQNNVGYYDFEDEDDAFYNCGLRKKALSMI